MYLSEDMVHMDSGIIGVRTVLFFWKRQSISNLP